MDRPIAEGTRARDALYLLGAIRFHAHDDLEYWRDDYYLKEAIRRSPQGELALEGFDMLQHDVARLTAPPAPNA